MSHARTSRRPLWMRLALAATLAVLCAAPASAAELLKLRLAHPGFGIFRLPLYTATLNNYFKEEGLDVEWLEMRSGSDAVKLLAGKGVDVVTSQVVDILNLTKQGIRSVGIASSATRINNSIVIPKRLEGEVKTFADLKGRPFGVTGIGSGTWQFAMFLTQQSGLTREDMNFVGVGTGAGVVGAVKSGRVDAMSYADPENYEMVRNGDAAFLIDMNDDATHRKFVGPAYQFSIFYTTAEFAKANPQAIQMFVNAIQKAINWNRSHTPEEVAALLVKHPTAARIDPKLLTVMLQRARLGWPQSAVITREAFEATLKMPGSAGIIDAPDPMALVIDNSFATAAAAKYPK